MIEKLKFKIVILQVNTKILLGNRNFKVFSSAMEYTKLNSAGKRFYVHIYFSVVYLVGQMDEPMCNFVVRKLIKIISQTFKFK